MKQLSLLRRSGLFDAKVPRYTSFPPANRFTVGVGERNQQAWLRTCDPNVPVSLYVHVPFCRRVCWFCACRTQGTKTLSPVESYLQRLLQEIDAVAGNLPPGLKVGRLHLGGGTPTLLSADMMERLLARIHQYFMPDDDFEFSVEIDPTEAADAVLRTLRHWGLNRASIGVQDFDPKVQEAIGRIQGLDRTEAVIATLRDLGVQGLNIDLLYGLPHQNGASLMKTLDRVVSLRPDRLALYGYAHVPHVSKRQVMIPEDALPDTEARFVAAQLAKERLVSLGFVAIGIDHFARPHDGLAQAAKAGTMIRSFQGYTDDSCQTLIGFGASAISKFPQGYLQNAVSTSAYQQRIIQNGFAARKGYVLSPEDKFINRLITDIMCQGQIDCAAVIGDFPGSGRQLLELIDDLLTNFPELLQISGDVVSIPKDLIAASRLIAARLDHALQEEHQHSVAV